MDPTVRIREYPVRLKSRALLLLCAAQRRRLSLPAELAYNIDVMLEALYRTAAQLEQERRAALRPTVLTPVSSGRSGRRAQVMMAQASKGSS
jgi:hypothetical protein